MIRAIPNKFSHVLSYLAIALLIAACACALCACSGTRAEQEEADMQVESSAAADEQTYELVTDGVLTVATYPQNRPFEYLEGNKLTGFDISLISEIASRLSLSVDIEEQSYNDLLALVAAGEHYDCAISAIDVGQSRSSDVIMSNPYLDAPLGIIVAADSKIATPDQLATLPVGALRASAAEKWAAQNMPDNPYTPFTLVSDLLGALDAGSIGVAICDLRVVNNINEDLKEDYVILQEIPTDTRYAIAVSTANPGLASAIDEALAEMREDGTLARLEALWFGAKTGE